MANRFTKTEKWKDKWFVSLSPYEKLVWNYLCDNCDNAGLFEPNARIDAFTIGISVADFEGALKGLIRGLIFSQDNEKIFIKKFLLHQNNWPLNPSNNAHKQILTIINSNVKKFDYDFTNLGASEGLISPLCNSNGKGNGNSKSKEGEKIEISEQDVLQTIRYLDLTQQVKYKPQKILDFWEAFLIQNQKNNYPNYNDKLKHFRDWLKTQKHIIDGKQNIKPIASNDDWDFGKL